MKRSISAEDKAIGIDIGGTKMAVAAVDHAGCIRARVSLPTEAEQGFRRAVQRLVEAVGDVTKQAGFTLKELKGIGIGCAGPVDPLRGTINNPYTLTGWNNCDIVSALSDRMGLRVRIENDADAALLGECFAGTGRGFDPVVMLTFGTGIGGGAWSGGMLVRGVAGGHPEIGHVPIDTNGPSCYCGINGCFESIASGTAIGLAGQQIALADSRAVFTASASGNSRARAIVDRAVRATEIAAWTLLHTLMPQRIILGGGLMDDHFDLFAGAIRASIKRATMLPAGQVDVAKAVLGNDAGLVGAASLVLTALARKLPQA